MFQDQPFLSADTKDSPNCVSPAQASEVTGDESLPFCTRGAEHSLAFTYKWRSKLTGKKPQYTFEEKILTRK